MSTWIDYILGRRKNTSAAVARERLQIILAHERSGEGQQAPAYLTDLQNDLVQVISKYIAIDPNGIKVSLERQGKLEVLEVNIVLKDDVVV
jgi:cell division topological specificity factor